MSEEFANRSGRQYFHNYLTDTTGASASEYAVLVALVIVAVTAALLLFNPSVYGTVNQIIASCVTGTC